MEYIDENCSNLFIMLHNGEKDNSILFITMIRYVLSLSDAANQQKKLSIVS